MKRASLFALAIALGIACGWSICSLKSRGVKRAITISDLNIPSVVIGETGLPLGQIMTLRGKVVVAPTGKHGDGGEESKIRIFTIDNAKPDKPVELPIVPFDGIAIPNGDGEVVIQGYERIEEIGYNTDHWQLYGKLWDERMKNGEEYDPAMCAYPREIRTYFLCLSIKAAN